MQRDVSHPSMHDDLNRILSFGMLPHSEQQSIAPDWQKVEDKGKHTQIVNFAWSRQTSLRKTEWQCHDQHVPLAP